MTAVTTSATKSQTLPTTSISQTQSSSTNSATATRTLSSSSQTQSLSTTSETQTETATPSTTSQTETTETPSTTSQTPAPTTTAAGPCLCITAAQLNTYHNGYCCSSGGWAGKVFPNLMEAVRAASNSSCGPSECNAVTKSGSGDSYTLRQSFTGYSSGSGETSWSFTGASTCSCS